MQGRAVMPRDKRVNLRFNPKTNRWDYLVRLVRPDGSLFRRAGSSVRELDAREKRNAAYREFNNDFGQAREAKKQLRTEGEDNLSNWTDRVLPVVREDCAPTTFEAYRHSLENHVLPALGQLRLEQLRPLLITETLQQLSEKHGPGVATQARSALSRILDIAFLDGRIPTNPVKSVRVGARERKLSRLHRAEAGDTGKRWLTLPEGQQLLAKVKGSTAYWPILLGLRFGLRSGEAMGLTWAAVDTEAQIIRVRQQAQYLKGSARHIAPPKSAAGIRDVPIPTDLRSELVFAKNQAQFVGQVWVCVDGKGAPLHPKHVTRLIKDAVVQAGFDGSDAQEVPTSHDFRSSFLTWLANDANDGTGVKPHVLMAIAGHSDINMAMKFYVKANVQDLATAVNSLSFKR
ncbi:MAG: tyrosine-type recombinase/integrase [Fimbriimonadaceae bacterium]